MRHRLIAGAAGLALVVVAFSLTIALVPSAHSDVTTTTEAPTTTTTTLALPPAVCRTSCVTWTPRDLWSGATHLVYTAKIPLTGVNAGQFAYAGWMRTAGTTLALYPGYKGPGPTSLARGPMQVPPAVRGRLLATFNSGFYEEDGAAGFYCAGRLYHPMINGLATVVRSRDGTVDIINWQNGTAIPSTVLMARQNLPLLVNNGVATPLAATNSRWGLTLHGEAAVWRTALGIDNTGNLFYVAAPNQTSDSLAALMVTLHAVRAMQLDINPAWPIFNVYGGAGARSPSMAVPNPNQIPGRFLYSSTKDFFALYVAVHQGEEQPW